MQYDSQFSAYTPDALYYRPDCKPRKAYRALIYNPFPSSRKGINRGASHTHELLPLLRLAVQLLRFHTPPDDPAVAPRLREAVPAASRHHHDSVHWMVSLAVWVGARALARRGGNFSVTGRPRLRRYRVSNTNDATFEHALHGSSASRNMGMTFNWHHGEHYVEDYYASYLRNRSMIFDNWYLLARSDHNNSGCTRKQNPLCSDLYRAVWGHLRKIFRGSVVYQFR